MKVMKGVYALAFFGCSLSAHGQVASFDCTRAATPAEKTICRVPSLGGLDVQMATRYDMLMSSPPAEEGMAYREFRDQLKADQRQWQINARDRCGADPSCLSQAYGGRIDTLRGLAAKHLALTFRTAGSGDRPAVAEALNAAYDFEGTVVRLVDGRYSEPVPGSSAVREVKIVGAPVKGIVSGKIIEAVVLNDDPGGSGTFLYVAAMLPGGTTTPPVFLGDRITVRSVAFQKDTLVVTYLDRSEDAPMSEPPTVKVVKRFDIKGGQLAPKS